MSADLIPLRSGLLIRADALALCLQLEAEGHALTAKEGLLLVSNGATLTAEQRTAITGLRLHLLGIAGEVARMEASPADPPPLRDGTLTSG